MLKDFGFFLVPANRSWDKLISFGSELFRRIISESSALPAKSIIKERDRLRNPVNPIENDDQLAPIIQNINREINNFFPEEADLKLRVTSTDSSGLLDTVVAHFTNITGNTVPAKKFGSGLISLQLLFLLLHFGYKRIEDGLSFCVALEEPEIHLPPGVQRRLLYRLQSLSSQTIITTHSPMLAAFCDPQSLIILRRNEIGEIYSNQLLKSPLSQSSTHSIRKLFQIFRIETVSALMHEILIIPEGRTDFEWLKLMLKVSELNYRNKMEDNELIFGSHIGIIPTQDAAITDTFKSFKRLHKKICPLVDGDAPGRSYINLLSELDEPPYKIIRWPINWEIEDVVGWIIGDKEDEFIERLNESLTYAPVSLEDLVEKLKSTERSTGGIKQDLVAYEIIANIIPEFDSCIERTIKLLNSIANCCLERAGLLFF